MHHSHHPEAPYNFVEVSASGAGPGEHVAESMGGARGPRRSIVEEAELEQAVICARALFDECADTWSCAVHGRRK